MAKDLDAPAAHAAGHELDNRRGRHDAQRKMRDWLGEIDHDLLEDYDDSDALDEIPVFERLKSRRKARYEA